LEFGRNARIMCAMPITWKTLTAAAGLCAAALMGAVSIDAQQHADGPRFADDKLLRPDGYRSWVFLGAGLGMTYNPEGAPSGRPQRFTNVFVNPSSYEYFRKTGTWPDQTILLLEIRQALTEGSINKGGNYQGEVVALEAHVRDSRFPDKSAFFNFGRGGTEASATMIPETASCYTCHRTNAAVDNTFVQFYPELMEIARQKGTIKAGYHH
jgi:hypothetical protein